MCVLQVQAAEVFQRLQFTEHGTGRRVVEALLKLFECNDVSETKKLPQGIELVVFGSHNVNSPPRVRRQGEY
jgi:hypothetical protein